MRGNTTQNSDTDLHSKLVLLTLTFPRLRVIWSSSPYATSDIFADLKMNRDEPDAVKAGSVGADDSTVGASGGLLAGEVEATVNQTPQELLRSLPGIVSIADSHHILSPFRRALLLHICLHRADSPLSSHSFYINLST